MVAPKEQVEEGVLVEPVKRFRPVAINVGVRDTQEANRRTLAAGAQQHFPPLDQEGLPRHLRFEDPSGNRIVLWQG